MFLLSYNFNSGTLLFQLRQDKERDIGIGRFFSKVSPIKKEECQGLCIYDATNGSLRLTQLLAEHFVDVLNFAIKTAKNMDDNQALKELTYFSTLVGCLNPTSPFDIHSMEGGGDDYAEIIAPGEKAIWTGKDGRVMRVGVITPRYTPRGLMYEISGGQKDGVWMVGISTLQPIYGETKMARINLMTGEIEKIEVN